ncbi:MAG: gamma-glutamylcyclotransferase [Leptolyngbya sp. SIOISBB]|nr:gamma-glutamylcyclotransferase [Leptolyngbya sp. SIOISBB]
MERLFVYGTLQPGGPNEHVLNAIGGEWEPAVIKGKLIAAGWGAGMGYPGLVIDDSGSEIQGYVFASPNLNDHWSDLDEFEGKEYERIVASVQLSDGEHGPAYVYVLQDQTGKSTAQN